MEEKEQNQLTTPLFDEREEKLINNCITYAKNNPAGLPGHNLMLIIAKQDEIIRQLVADCNSYSKRYHQLLGTFPDNTD